MADGPDDIPPSNYPGVAQVQPGITWGPGTHSADAGAGSFAANGNANDAAGQFCSEYLGSPGGNSGSFFGCVGWEQSAAITQDSSRIQSDLLKLQTGNDLQSNSAIEADLRNTFFSLTPTQVTQVEQTYKQANTRDLNSAIQSNSAISQDTKEILAASLVPPVVQSGSGTAATEQRTAKLLDISLQRANPEIFSQVMAYATPEARQAFLNNNGAARIDQAFGAGSTNAQQALQYAQQGRLDTLSKVKADSSLIFGSNKGITLALQQMSQDERQTFINGARVAQGMETPGLTDQQKTSARTYHDQMVDAFNRESNKAQALAWQYMIFNGPQASSFVPSLARHFGYLGSDSISEINRDVYNMSPRDWQDCKANPVRRDQAIRMLQALDINGNDINKFLSVYDTKIGAASFEQGKPATAGGSSPEYLKSYAGRQPDLSPQEITATANKQTAVARSGWFSWITGIFNGTGKQADDAALHTNTVTAQINQMQQQLLQQKSRGLNPSAQQAAYYLQLAQKLDGALEAQYQATGNYVDSKRIISEYASDAALAGLGIVAPFGAAIVLGAAGKPLIKAAIQGNNYDPTHGHLVTDAATGALDAAVGFAGSNVVGLPRMGVEGGKSIVSYGLSKVP